MLQGEGLGKLEVIGKPMPMGGSGLSEIPSRKAAGARRAYLLGFVPSSSARLPVLDDEAVRVADGAIVPNLARSRGAGIGVWLHLASYDLVHLPIHRAGDGYSPKSTIRTG